MNDMNIQKQFLSRSIPNFNSELKENSFSTIGVLEGEGVGPEVIDAALKVLETLSTNPSRKFKILKGGDIGLTSFRKTGQYFCDDVIGFCRDIFSQGGAILCGPGGGRFVYELRAHFDLYCKFTPLIPLPELRDSAILNPDKVENVNIIAVRENTSGLYFGEWGQKCGTNGDEQAIHTIVYNRYEVDRILTVAAELARTRKSKLCLTLKPNGVPAISQLWEERARSIINEDIELTFLEIDNAVYQLIANAQEFDVVVSPNMFGDVLADCGALLLGSRGMSFSGNFGSDNRAVYQTGHGAAYDIAGSDVANPIGQIMSLAMMLRESYYWPEGAYMIENAVKKTLAQGYRTIDLAGDRAKVLGTRAMTEKICENIEILNPVI